jgi:parallel beta-helix repeat protein
VLYQSPKNSFTGNTITGNASGVVLSQAATRGNAFAGNTITGNSDQPVVNVFGAATGQVDPSKNHIGGSASPPANALSVAPAPAEVVTPPAGTHKAVKRLSHPKPPAHAHPSARRTAPKRA